MSEPPEQLRFYMKSVMLAVGSFGLLFGAAFWLWQLDDAKARGAAITVVGVAATHLVKEVQEILAQIHDDARRSKPP